MPLGVDDGLQHVQLSGCDGMLEGCYIVHAHAWQGAYAEDGHQDCPAQQQHDLDIFRHHHGLEAAESRVGDGEQRQYEDGGKHRHAEQTLEDLGSGEEADADVYQQRA